MTTRHTMGGPTPLRRPSSSLSSPPFTSPKSTAALALSSLFHSSAPFDSTANSTEETAAAPPSRVPSSSVVSSSPEDSMSSSTASSGGGGDSTAAATRHESSSVVRRGTSAAPFPPLSSTPSSNYHPPYSASTRRLPHEPILDDDVSPPFMRSSSMKPHHPYNSTPATHYNHRPSSSLVTIHRPFSSSWDEGHSRFGMFVETTRRFANYQPNHPGAPYFPPPAPMEHSSSSRSRKASVRRQSETAGLVTPTPRKKAKSSTSKKKNTNLFCNEKIPAAESDTPSSYSRKTKSLGLLCENFMEAYKSDGEVCIDQAAKLLGVERRRIYDIINILESMNIVTRKRKNTYHWHGLDNLPRDFGELQEKAFDVYQQDAIDHGLLVNHKRNERQPTTSSDTKNKATQAPPKSTGSREKSLGRLSQQFLQLFLVGHDVVSLTEASDKILGSSTESELAALARKGKRSNVDDKSSDPPTPDMSLQAAAARGLKTKIRRLYDIANVLVSVGLVQKIDKSRKAKPAFRWTYSMLPMEIRQQHLKTTKQVTSNSTNKVSPDAVGSQHIRNDRDLLEGQNGGSVKPASPTSAPSSPVGNNHLFAAIHESGACIQERESVDDHGALQPDEEPNRRPRSNTFVDLPPTTPSSSVGVICTPSSPPSEQAPEALEGTKTAEALTTPANPSSVGNRQPNAETRRQQPIARVVSMTATPPDSSSPVAPLRVPPQASSDSTPLQTCGTNNPSVMVTATKEQSSSLERQGATQSVVSLQ